MLSVEKEECGLVFFRNQERVNLNPAVHNELNEARGRLTKEKVDAVGDVGGVKNGDGNAGANGEWASEADDVQCIVPLMVTLPAESDADDI